MDGSIRFFSENAFPPQHLPVCGGLIFVSCPKFPIPFPIGKYMKAGP
jgi:hypothetical protein